MERNSFEIDYEDDFIEKMNKSDLLDGKVPPQAIDLEEIVLGALILESDAITKVDLMPEVFYKSEHQMIFNIIEKLNNEGKNIDLITVTTALKDKNILDQVGGPVAITKLTEKIASAVHLEQYVKILLQYYIRRELIKVSSRVLEYSYDTSMELDDIMNLYDKTVTEIDRILIGKYKGRELYLVLKDLNVEIERRYQLSKIGGLTGITTGFGILNKYTSGWQPGWLVVFASRPAMGKTAIAINRFAKEAARNKHWVNIFSLEMDDISLAERLVIGSSGIDTYNFKNGQLTDEDWIKYNKAVEELNKYSIFIDDSPYVRVSHIRNVARVNKRNNKCDLIIIDYLQLADAGDDNKKRNREQEVSDICRRLKGMAKELNVPIILISQLSREVEKRSNRRPVLSDLRESGSIEQDADMVIFPYRPGYYESLEGKEKSSNEGILILAKNRHGRIGDIEFYYNDTMTDFSDEPLDETLNNEYDPERFISSQKNNTPF
jgi:replicative DNA helicase